VNGQAAYTMQVGGVNVSPQSASHMIVSLNGTIQKPNSSFTVSGSTITFASNLATGDVIDFIQILGDVLDLGVPSDATVSLAKLTATGTKDATTFLRGDNTFASAGLSNWSESSGNLLPSNDSYGIYLGVNSATATNLLNDYEEGTWTPAFSFSSGSVSYSGGFPKGTYRKIGKIVHVQFALSVNSASSPSGNTSISGLPFTTSSVSNSESSAYIGITRNLGSAHNNLRAYTNDSNTVIQLPVNSTSSGFSGLQGSDIQNTTLIYGNATYFTD
jgi:hypothetical protein